MAGSVRYAQALFSLVELSLVEMLVIYGIRIGGFDARKGLITGNLMP